MSFAALHHTEGLGLLRGIGPAVGQVCTDRDGSGGGRGDEPAQHAEEHKAGDQGAPNPVEEYRYTRAVCRRQRAHGVVKLAIRIGQSDGVRPIRERSGPHDND